MPRTAWLVVGIVVTLAAAVAVWLTSSSPRPSAERLCFVRDDQVHCGGAALTFGPRAHFPAGVLGDRLLVVESAGEGEEHVERLLLVALDGGVTELHGDARRARAPAPGDGDVVMESSRAGFSDLWRLSLDGGAEQLTHDGEAGSFEPQRFDGGLVYVSSRDGDPELYLWPSGARLTRHPSEDVAPRLSPDGERVVFVSSREGSDRLYLLPRGGGEPKPLHAEPLDPGPKGKAHREDVERDAVWTPDGREVVFAARAGGGHLRLWAADAQTGAVRALTDGQQDDDQPAVSPDGKWVAFTRGEPGQLWVVPLGGGAATQVAERGWLPRWVR